VETGETLGLDVGIKRTGIARASSVARLAEPLISTKTADVVKTLDQYIKQHRVDAVVVGLPRNMQNDDTEQTAWVREWVDNLKGSIEVPIYWQDEALTTVQAANLEQQHKADVDSLSAAIILQNFLDAPVADRNPV
jgi:putative Holliday junction resolvase